MNVLSLFDGMSCCQLALNDAGIPINKYYASEVDKAAIEQTKHSFPDTVHLGDVSKIDGTKFAGKIDLLAGGSPCTDFSFSGKTQGMTTECNELITTLDKYLELKAGGFEFVGQSYLFWEFVRLLKEIQPRYFFLENTRMEARWAGVITEALGVMPVEVNSAILSAQNRKRFYWSNIKTEQNGFFDNKTYFPNLIPSKQVLRDILEPVADIDDGLIMKNLPADFNGLNIDRKGRTLRVGGTLVKNYKHTYDIINDCRIGINYCQFDTNGKGHNSQRDRAYFDNCKHGSLLATRTDDKTGVITNNCVRRLSVLECQRLQTVPDDFVWVVAKTNQYKMLGNGWTVKVIVEFFKPLKDKL